MSDWDSRLLTFFAWTIVTLTAIAGLHIWGWGTKAIIAVLVGLAAGGMARRRPD